MKLKKGQEKYYNDYKESANANPKAKQAFEIANNYADKVEALLEADKNLKLEEAFETALENMSTNESVSGYVKSSAYTMLTKVWAYGTEFNDYTVKLEDGYAKMM